MAGRRWGPGSLQGVRPCGGLLEPGLRESDGAAGRVWDASVGDWSARLLVVLLLRFWCLLTPNSSVASQYGRTALMLAADYGEESCVGMLLACGADTTLRNKVWRPAWADAGGRAAPDTPVPLALNSGPRAPHGALCSCFGGAAGRIARVLVTWVI